MRFWFYYNLIDGRVASYSEGKNDMPKFLQIELEVTEKDYEKMRQNYKLYIRDGKLICEKPQRIMDEEEKEKKQNAKDELVEKLKDSKVQLKDIKDLLLQLI